MTLQDNSELQQLLAPDYELIEFSPQELIFHHSKKQKLEKRTPVNFFASFLGFGILITVAMMYSFSQTNFYKYTIDFSVLTACGVLLLFSRFKTLARNRDLSELPSL